MNPQISLIIPYYNVEKYIAHCLDSVYNQDIPEEMYEVICIDDASLDKSKEIVREYQKKHTNLILIEHEVNKKLGPARNTGRSVAKGKYIWNIDSDDYIQPNVLKSIIEICESNNLDLFMFNYDVNNNQTESKHNNPPFCNSLLMTGIQFIDKYFKGRIGNISQVWSQVYRLDFLNQNNIYSPEINMAEDGPYTWKSLIKAQRVLSVESSYYVYRINDMSLTAKMKTKPTPLMIYEKCFVFSSEVLGIIEVLDSKSNFHLIQNFKQIIRYTIGSFRSHIKELSLKEIIVFRRLCITDRGMIKVLYPFMNRFERLFLRLLLLFK